jgi:hypothetical protein
MPSHIEKAGDRRFTAYCGIYCKDCIPSDAAFFKALEELRGHLDRVGFDEYARAIAKSDTKFNEYPVFEEVLGEIEKLKCVNFCREGGCKPGCRIRECAIGRAYEGCWECADHPSCGLLRPLKAIHPSLEHNLEMVREHGIDGWSGWRGKHYKWSKERGHDESG